MNSIHVLDCTLRDGGYCNQWQFGRENIEKIVVGLCKANIDIIECGYLTSRENYNPDISKFTKIEQINSIIAKAQSSSIFVLMMNYGEYDVDLLPECGGSSITGIRVAFHKKNLEQALVLCRQIKEKGYKVFIQPMVSLGYTDEEFLDLIFRVNELLPYAFYIVDSFGMMKGKDLVRLFYMVEHNLNENIGIGFHSHNNMQLAYSNAQSLTNVQTSRNLIIDSSVYGMGRGAGNLNTELFVEYLNENVGKNYCLRPLLAIIDGILNEFYQRNYWGYSLPNYLSASHNAHPSYAAYLDDKKTLNVEDMNEIFELMEEGKKQSFDKDYIEKLYFRYMTNGKVQEGNYTEFQEKLSGKRVLLIAPGKSSTDERERILNFAGSQNLVTISINYDYPYIDTDFIFLSNLRRFRELDLQQRKRCIVTSNITVDDVYLQLKYADLLNEEECVKDNAGMMAVKFLISCGVKEIYLAGFDGYSHDVDENYGEHQMEFITKKDILDAMNVGMKRILNRYAREVEIRFLTKPRHIILE